MGQVVMWMLWRRLKISIIKQNDSSSWIIVNNWYINGQSTNNLHCLPVFFMNSKKWWTPNLKPYLIHTIIWVQVTYWHQFSYSQQISILLVACEAGIKALSRQYLCRKFTFLKFYYISLHFWSELISMLNKKQFHWFNK